MSKLVVANWKMNGSIDLVDEFAKTFTADNLILGLPTIFLSPFRNRNSILKLAAQDCSMFQGFGAHTGEISARMLRESGIEYVILGHSERRSISNLDSTENILQKLSNAMDAGLSSILCIDENFDQLIDEKTTDLLRNSLGKVILAFEPVSAIGTGIVPNLSDIRETVSKIKEKCDGINTLYGGSVNSINAREIMDIPEIDGVLVGGASLKIPELTAILQASSPAV
ncbi:MAG: triose-phosphate isomerase [Holosporales bacterium]|jgi:triosephosphate isomerase|nr:triose-phosphate isomerase [Holosporales bacterium]